MKSRNLFLVSVVLFIIFGMYSALAAAQIRGTCPGFVSRLKLNENARVTPGEANNIRAMPDRESAKVGQIPEEEIFEVIGGPVCADDLTWWEVRYGEITGWTVEGTEDEYWTEPMRLISIPTPSTATVNFTEEPIVKPANPQDSLLLAIAYVPAGGGSDVVRGICGLPSRDPQHLNLEVPVEHIDRYPQFMQSLLTVYHGVFATVGITNSREYGVRRLISGETIELGGAEESYDSSSGSSFPSVDVFSGSTQTFDLPKICSMAVITPERVSLISEDGRRLNPVIEGDMTSGYQVSLPEDFRDFTGTWRFRVDDFELTLIVTPNLAPNFSRTEGYELENFAPNERVIILRGIGNEIGTSEIEVNTDGSFTWNEDKIQSSRRWVIPSQYRQGYIIYDEYEEPLTEWISGFVGETGNTILFKHAFSESALYVENHYRLPAELILHDVFWDGATMDDIRQWTCPGALPIRLSAGQPARVIQGAGEQIVYSTPDERAFAQALIPQNSIFAPVEGIWCTPNTVWWKVSVENMGSVFIKESQGDTYFLEPLPGATPAEVTAYLK